MSVHDDALPRDVPPDGAAAELLAGGGEAVPGQGPLRAALANAMVGLKKRFYGRGPDAAKAWILDDYVFVALEGGLTRNEETLLAAGRSADVRAFRLSFQEVMGPTTIQAVEELVGRKVLGYHSQIVFEPTRGFEIFVLGEELDRPPGAAQPLTAPSPS